MTWSAPIERTSPSLLGAADAGDFRSECLGDLHGVGADTTRGADDQHLLPGLQAAESESAQRGHPGDRHGSGLLEGELRRLERQLVLACGRELGERALADAEHLVAWWKRVTSLPTATTTPATSRPGTGFFGARRPATSRAA